MNKTRLINIYITKYVKNRGVFLLERALSHEERIRRAEEIYYRRRENSNSVRMSSSQVKEGNENRRISLYKKMKVYKDILVLNMKIRKVIVVY